MANQSQVVVSLVSVRAKCAPLALPTDLRGGQLHDRDGSLTPCSIVHTQEPVHGRHEQVTRVTGLDKARRTGYVSYRRSRNREL
jgi:hypothetical protein